MPANLTTLDGIFKRNYSEGSEVLKQQQNLSAPFWSKIKVSSLKPSPQGTYSTVGMSGNEDGGAIFPGEGFVESGSYNPQQPFITPKKVHWPFEITGDVIELSQNDKVAFAKGLDTQQKDNLARITNSLNRQSHGTGTGQVTLANGGDTSTSLVVDDPFPFRRGMRIDAYQTLGGALQIDGIRITAVNYTTRTLTLASTQTWSDNAVICMYGALRGTSVGNYKEIMGLRGIFDTTTFSTTFEGLSVAANPEWVGNVVTAGAAISQDIMQQAHNQVAVIGGMKPNTLMSNYGQARNFLNTELDKTRYEPGTVKGGNVTLMWGGLEWIVDHTFPIGELVMFDMSQIEKFQTRDVHISDLPGYTLYQKEGYDAVGGYYIYRGNIGTWKRNSGVRIITLDEPTF